jgi:site-specific DNA-cytosine methylase
VEVVAAFDQDSAANRIYEVNYGLKPGSRNLDTIKACEIPFADIWWMSPPCTPYTVRGAQRDACDPRAASILNLIKLVSQVRPKALLLENVLGFSQSTVLGYLKNQLATLEYQYLEITLCPTQLGVPMKRPRYFICAWSADCNPKQSSLLSAAGLQDDKANLIPLSRFLSSEWGDELKVNTSDLTKHWQSLNIVDPYRLGETTICFTSSYGKCLKASGSLLHTQDGTVRRFAPIEILRLLGFPSDFIMPGDLSLAKQWRLVGNSVNVGCVRIVLNLVTGWLDDNIGQNPARDPKDTVLVGARQQ